MAAMCVPGEGSNSQRYQGYEHGESLNPQGMPGGYMEINLGIIFKVVLVLWEVEVTGMATTILIPEMVTTTTSRSLVIGITVSRILFQGLIT